MKYGNIGTLIHATHRPDDLLTAFSDELERLVLLNGDYFSRPENFSERDELNNLIGEARDAWEDDGETLRRDIDTTDLVFSLQEKLDDFAPPYCYFGTHEGDGSDFGFWPVREAIEGLPRYSEIPDELPDEPFTVVNDRGNLTLYEIKRVAKEVWSIV